MVEEISASLDKGKVTAGVLLDLSKAFDTVDHSLLVNKLEKYGIRGTALNWLESYLQDRRQYTEINHKHEIRKSNSAQVVCGVPQGSILGPTLFILYTNDIFNVCKTATILQYADDTVVLCTGKDSNDLSRELDKSLETLSSWFSINKLSLNVKKTQCITFGKSELAKSLEIKGIKVPESDNVKYLGMLIDKNLSWEAHISQICRKISKTIGMLGRVKNFLNIRSKTLLYDSLVKSHLLYGIELWGKAAKKHLNKLFIMQKKAIRYILKLSRNSHTKSGFKSLSCLNIYQLYTQSLCNLMFFVNKGIAPKAILCKFKKIKEIHTRITRSAISDDYFMDHHGSKSTSCPSVTGVLAWNLLPPALRNIRNKAKFKKLLKKHILETTSD